MASLSYIVVLLLASSIAAQVVFSPSAIRETFTIPTPKENFTANATLTSDNINGFSWEIVQKIGECKPSSATFFVFSAKQI